MDAVMKKTMTRVLTLLALTLLAAAAFSVSASAESAPGDSFDSFSIYAGTQLDSSGNLIPGWQTAQIGSVNSCPSDIKLWRDENGLWLNFEYYHDPYATKPLEIRLRADKWNGIATIENGRISASGMYFGGSEAERLIADFGTAYGWHHISVKISQSVTLNGSSLAYAWQAIFSVDGGEELTFNGDPACFGIGMTTGTAPVWKLFDAALSPDGSSVDFERASPAPSTGTYLRFYFYGGGFYNNDESERSLLRIRNVRSYYGDASEEVRGVCFSLGGGNFVTNAVTNAVCSTTGSYVAKAYHATYDTYEYTHFLREGESMTLPTPERKGLRFTGWYADAALTEAVTTLTALTSDVVLYAGWEPTSVVVSYDFDGGKPANGASYPTELPFGTTEILLAEPTKTNSEFLGWRVNGAGEPIKAERVPISPSVSDPTVSLTAVWKRSVGSVSFVVPSELSPSGELCATFPLDSASDILFPTLSGEGFAGWYLSPDYEGERVTAYRTAIGEADLVFYAKYEKLFYDYDFSSSDLPTIRFYNSLAADGFASAADGSMHWKVPQGDCSSDMPLSLAPKASTLIIEMALRGSVECSYGEVRIRLRAAGSGNDTTLLTFTNNGMMIGASNFGTVSENEFTSVRLVLSFVNGGVLVDGYLNGALVVENEMISSALGVPDSEPLTIDCARFNFYVGLSAAIDLYFDYFYICEGSTPKYTA